MFKSTFGNINLAWLVFLFSFLSLNNIQASGEPATVSFSLDECTSYYTDGTNRDFSEFTPEITNNNGITITVLRDHLYRNNPDMNGHSCTPGINGTEAMCVSSNSSCDFEPNAERAVRFDLMVDVDAGLTATLNSLKFHEMAPEMFQWIDGADGVNNYPTLYGIRVLKDNNLIYESTDIPTTQDWTEEIFNFDSFDFLVSGISIFNFELLAYCPVGAASLQQVWDLDQIEVEVTPSPSNIKGGTLTGGPFNFCVGDGVADNIAPGSITLDGATGSSSQWVVTDDQGIILGLPPMPSVVDFDGAGTGTCLIWHVSFEGDLTGVAVGNNALSDIQGCYALSNAVTVNRNTPVGGTLAGGTFEFCVGDGQPDNIAPGSITLTGNVGGNSQWVVTDLDGNILGLPPMPSAVNFDGAGPGTCLIWHLSFEDGLTGAAVGNNALSDLDGCYSLSNSIAVVRNEVNGGALLGGPFEFCVGDGQADNLAPGSIELVGNTGANSQWVVTDEQGMILGLPPMPSVVDFDGAGPGTCLIWHLSFETGLTGAVVGNNALTDLVGCYDLSNSVSVVRTDASICNPPVVGGTITGGPFEFCVGDGVADNIPAGSISVSGNTGTSNQWVVTDPQGNILGLPPMPSAVDFDGAGPGVCLVWNLTYNAGLTGLVPGNNVSALMGNFALSNSISVTRNQPAGGTLAGGPFEFCVGDGVADNLAAGSIVLSGNSGTNSQWVVTDDQGNILGLPPMPSAVDFDGAGLGTCLIWHLSFEDGLTGAAVGNNAMTDLVGCYSLSNSVAVSRIDCGAPISGGSLAGGPFEFCVGDGVADNLAPGSITLSGNTGSVNQWVVTDDQGNILGLPPMPSAVDFDGAGPGTCLIWNLSYEPGLTGLAMGNNVSVLSGEFSLSNSVSVVRNQPVGGSIAGGPFTFCVGDGVADNIQAGGVVLAGNSGGNSQWVVTDDQGNILGLPPTPFDVDFDGAGTGTCLIWHLSFENGLTGAAVGNNAMTDLVGCYSLSNSIAVTREDCTAAVNGGTLAGGPFEFCVGDGVADNLAPGSITLTGNMGTTSQWVVTDDQGNILGLPPMPSAVDFDGAGPGTCLIWNISYEPGLTGLAMGNNVSGLSGDYALSNSVAVVRNQPAGGTISGGPFTFCVGDGVADNIQAGGVVLAGNSGGNSQWVVTDDQGNILGLPPTPFDVDFDGAGTGTCLIWHLSFENGLTGAAVGNNAMTDLVGCYSLSNSIAVTR